MVNKLENLREFKELLKGYRVSPAGKKILESTKLALLVGPSSAGRNTIIRELTKVSNYHFIVSDTTRKPRVNDGVLEQNGVEYWFKTEEEFLSDLRAGLYLEAAVIHDQQVSGISIRELSIANKRDEIAITDIEVVGTQNIINEKPDTDVFFIVPPSFEVWMQRMDGRGKVSAIEKRRRLESAVKEFEIALQSDYYIFVVNDTFEHSVEYINQRMLLGKHDPLRQRLDREVTERLLIETKAYVGKYSQ